MQKLIHPALDLAVDDDLIYKNPANGCMKEYEVQDEVKYALTFEQEREFLERIKLRQRIVRYYPLYAILLYTGLRIGEICGLTWNDVNMDTREIDVNHQLQYRRFGDVMKLYCIDPNNTKGRARTKTKSGMDIKTVQYLMGHSDMRTTVKVYDHVDLDRTKRELEKYSIFQKTINGET